MARQTGNKTFVDVLAADKAESRKTNADVERSEARLRYSLVEDHENEHELQITANKGQL